MRVFVGTVTGERRGVLTRTIPPHYEFRVSILALEDIESIERDREALRTVARLSSSTTTITDRQLRTLVECYQPTRLLLAARPDELNGAALVAVVYRAGDVYLADLSLLNVARPSRAREVRAVLDAVSRCEHLHTSYVTNYVPDTRDLSPAAAVRSLEREPTAPYGSDESVRAYLKLLGLSGAMRTEYEWPLAW